MKKSIQKLALIFLIALNFGSANAQGCSSLNLTSKSDMVASCGQMVMTMIHDAKGKPYLYVANKEVGLRVYDISNPALPVLKHALYPIFSFDTMDVMSLTQKDNYVYVALGNHFNDKQPSGMAIVKVDTPTAAWVTAKWKMPNSKGGAGVIAVEGNYAYLGCMGNGMAVLDVSNKHNIVHKSTIKPDINFPTASPNAALYNARGMTVKNGIVYLCYDAGGIRIINCTNPSAPKETGRYSNPVLNGKTRAYNNCQLDDSLLYVGCDYCGVEILNVKDTHSIKLIGRWNPYGCPDNNWFTSPVHANELVYEKNCKLLFVATGKSDLHVLNVADPTHPDSCNMYGGVSNSKGTWGVSLFSNQVYLSYVCAVIPFSSSYTAVKLLTYTTCNVGDKNLAAPFAVKIFPNPVHDLLRIEIEENGVNQHAQKLIVMDASGREIKTIENPSKSIELEAGNWPSGVYQIILQNSAGNVVGRFVKNQN